MNNLRRVANKGTSVYRTIPLLLFVNPAKFHYSAMSNELPTTKHIPQPNYLDILLDNIPAPWANTQTKDISDTTAAFKKWIQFRHLSEEDGKMLNTLKEHIINGGHPDFPRLTKDNNNNKCLKHWTDDYYTSIDTKCFKWLKKQRQLYRNKSIHPWLHWKLLQLNVTLKWTREPLQDRDFRWMGYYDDVLNNADTASLCAESDPLFPLHSSDEPLLKFLNPFYELWYENMPQTLKQLRLINANKEPPNEGYTDKDDIRATRIIKRYDTETHEWRYYIGAKNIDQQKIDAEILHKSNGNAENEQNGNEKDPILRTSYLGKDLYDKNSYSLAEMNELLADKEKMNELGVESMNYLRAKETKKEMKDSFESAAVRPTYSKRQRAEYFIEALKRDLIEASHLNLKELILIIQHLGLEYHPKQNPNAKRMNDYMPYSSPMKRKEAKTKWNDWNGNKAVEIYEFRPQRYTDRNGVFSELDIYHKTRHPGQPPWGVWEIPEPNLDVEYFQIKVEAYLKCWRQSAEGRQFIKNQLQRKDWDGAQCEKLKKGIELLREEKANKCEKINDNKQFRYKFGNDIAWQPQCKEKTLEIQKLNCECQQIEEILESVYRYNALC